MSRRFWKRLAGCTAISCCAAISWTVPASPEYKAGVAVEGPVKALVLEDRRGNRAVFTEAGFPITRALSDFIAAQLVKEHNLDRAAIVLRGTGDAAPQPEAVAAAVASALHNLDRAAATFDGAVISIRTPDGACLFAIPSGTCAEGRPVRSPIRAAFQMVEAEGGLQKRGDARAAYPVQSIGFGKEAAILALGGDAHYPTAKGLVLVPFANDTVAAPADERLSAAIRRVLSRVGR
jgi:hypothetical protein